MLVVLLKCSESMVRVGVSPCADHNENVGQLYVRNRAGEPKCGHSDNFLYWREFSCAVTHDPAASAVFTRNVDYVCSK